MDMERYKTKTNVYSHNFLNIGTHLIEKECSIEVFIIKELVRHS